MNVQIVSIGSRGLPISRGGGGGGGTPIYGLYRYVPRNRVWFLRFSVLKWGIFFDPFVSVSLVWSLDRLPYLYYLILECEKARLNEHFF